ncbi:unnamed protein product, partial [Meganyctiphanes norvegica]
SSSQPHLTHSQPALSNPIPATLHSNSQPALSTSYQQPHLVISTHPPINHPATPSSLPTTSRSLSTTSSPHLPLSSHLSSNSQTSISSPHVAPSPPPPPQPSSQPLPLRRQYPSLMQDSPRRLRHKPSK